MVSLQCDIDWLISWFFSEWKWVGWTQNLIGFPWHGQELVSEGRKRKGRERLGGKRWKKKKKAQTFASVCLAPVYGLNNSVLARGKWHMGALKCLDIFCSNRFFYGWGKRPGGAQPVRICLCLIKGSNFLFISDPHPPTQSSCLLIPPLQTAPTPPTPTPGPPAGVLPACASACYTPGLGTGRLYALCQQARGWALTNPHCPMREWWQRRRRGASLSGFYSNPGTHTGLGGSKGCRRAYRAPSLGPKSIQSSAQARPGRGAGSLEPLTQLLPSLNWQTLLANQQVILDLTKLPRFTKCYAVISGEKNLIPQVHLQSKCYLSVNKGLWLPVILKQSSKFVLSQIL